jgi:hypothetical protein
MGTSYKGRAIYFRSIEQNILLVSRKYDYVEGYFGKNSKHGRNRIRNISAHDSLAVAKDFYNRIAYGGKEQIISDNLRITRMADGSVITMRKVSHSDGTPAIDINVKPSKHTGGVKSQKIHFVQEEN